MSSQAGKTTELNVHVAASMSAVFTSLGDAFEDQFPDVSLKFNFGGSATLATQIQQGAPADIVVMADSSTIEKLIASGDVRSSDVADLAYNRLAILVQRGNPEKIKSLADLTRPDLAVIQCDSSQPCGAYADTLLSRGNIALKAVSREANASTVVARVASGEADAGISYITDGLAAGDKVDVVSIPESLNVAANYPMAVVAEPSSRDSSAIAAFVSMARGALGDELLRNAGFELP
jgi:molybdate transport system substrate-binding protein